MIVGVGLVVKLTVSLIERSSTKLAKLRLRTEYYASLWKIVPSDPHIWSKPNHLNFSAYLLLSNFKLHTLVMVKLENNTSRRSSFIISSLIFYFSCSAVASNFRISWFLDLCEFRNLQKFLYQVYIYNKVHSTIYDIQIVFTAQNVDETRSSTNSLSKV